MSIKWHAVEVAPLFQKSATPSWWTPNISPHCLANSQVWL